jgi:hypothetical protein
MGKASGRLMDRLQENITALRALARQSNDPNAQVVAERQINEFLRGEGNATITTSLELIGKTIDEEANKNIPGEDWSLMQAYVQWFGAKLKGCPIE